MLWAQDLHFEFLDELKHLWFKGLIHSHLQTIEGAFHQLGRLSRSDDVRKLSRRIRLNQDDLLLDLPKNAPNNVLAGAIPSARHVKRFWTLALCALYRSAVGLLTRFGARCTFLGAVSQNNPSRNCAQRLTRFQRSLTIASTPITTLSLACAPSSKVVGSSTSSTHASGTTIAHSSCAIQTLEPSLVVTSPSHAGGSCTRNSPLRSVDTHKQQGNVSGSFGLGPSFKVTFGNLDGDWGGGGTTTSTLLIFVLCLLGLGGPSSLPDLRLRGLLA